MLDASFYIKEKYKIVKKIRQCGTSVLYLVTDERTNAQWIVKVVKKEEDGDSAAPGLKLLAKKESMTRLHHPNLPEIVDVEECEDCFLVVMEHIPGESLDVLLKDGPIPQQTVVEWGKQLCGVLGYLHSRTPPIIYRDMKPSNIICKPDGTLVLIDFDTVREFKSKSTSDTVLLGTVGYAAPEQFGGRGQSDARTDIYCLGATLYHLLTGHVPVDNERRQPITYWNPALSVGLERIIQKCTSVDAADRYQSCAELQIALHSFREIEKEERYIRKNKWRVFLSLAVASLVFLVVSLGLLRKGTSGRDTAYKQFIQDAASVNDIDLLRQATVLFPLEEAPYTTALALVMEDGRLERNEWARLSELLQGEAATGVFRENCADKYSRICYNTGVALFFCYEDSNAGFAESREWLRRATEAAPDEASDEASDEAQTGLSKAQRESAAALIALANVFYEPEGGADSGDMPGKAYVVGEANAAGIVYSYRAYWDDLTDLTAVLSSNDLKNIPAQVRVSMYKRVYHIIEAQHDALLDAGVSGDELEDVKEAAVKDLHLMKDDMKDNTSAAYREVSALITDFEKFFRTAAPVG